MPYSRGDVIWADLPRLDPHRSPKARYALVLSENAYNDDNDHGVVVAISSGVPSERLPGVYVIANWKELKLDRASVVVPWLFTVEWDVVTRKASDLSPYQLREVTKRLREVISI